MVFCKFINNLCIQTSKPFKPIALKKRTYIIAVHFILLAACSFSFANSGKSGSDAPTQLSAVEARVEIMGSEAFNALHLLSTPANVDFSNKSEEMPASTEIEEPKVSPYLKMTAEKSAFAGEPDPSEGWKWQYNFTNQVFDLVNPSSHAF